QSGPLVARDLLTAIPVDFRLVDGSAGLHHEHGRHDFAEVAIGYADHARLQDILVAEQSLFDLPRIDVEAARNDHVLLAPDNEEIAGGIHAAEIAGHEPAVSHRFGGQVGPLPVFELR